MSLRLADLTLEMIRLPVLELNVKPGLVSGSVSILSAWRPVKY